MTHTLHIPKRPVPPYAYPNTFTPERPGGVLVSVYRPADERFRLRHGRAPWEDADGWDRG